jgi:hypothetical protein
VHKGHGRVEDVVCGLTGKHEADNPQPWSADDAPDSLFGLGMAPEP